MPNIQNLVLTDRQATPVAHTLTPKSGIGGIATVAKADSTGSEISEKRYSISTRTSGVRRKTTVKFYVPVVQTETVNGIQNPVVVREAYVDATFSFHRQHTEAERNDVIGMFASSLEAGKILVNDTVVKGQGVFGA